MPADEAPLMNTTSPEDVEKVEARDCSKEERLVLRGDMASKRRDWSKDCKLPSDVQSAETAVETELPVGGRPWCDKCSRPRKICLCATLPADGLLDTRTRVMLLVHPKEEQRALGTAPLLRLCLQHLIVKVGERFPEPDEDPELHAALCEGGHRPMLVCPGNNAEEMRAPPEGEEAAAEEVLFSQPPATLIFIDGRWPQAKTMVNRSVWLQQIPRAVLFPTSTSGYVFRKQPKEGCLSTLEAVAEALLALEGRRGPALKEALLAPFSQMVQLQCPFIPGIKDKNAKVEGDAQGLQPFDGEALLREATDEQLKSYYCVVRGGETSVEGVRETIVMDVLQGPKAGPASKGRAIELSAGRPRGQRCWVLPLGKVPAGSRMEADALKRGDEPAEGLELDGQRSSSEGQE